MKPRNSELSLLVRTEFICLEAVVLGLGAVFFFDVSQYLAASFRGAFAVVEASLIAVLLFSSIAFLFFDRRLALSGFVTVVLGLLAAMPHGDSTTYHTFSFAGVVRRGLTKFDSEIIDAHKQRYGMSCIPSSVEMVLKLEGRVPSSYYDLQTAWKEKSDGSFRDFDGKTIAGVTFHQQFSLPRNRTFPLAEEFATIHNELQAGRFVIVGLPSSGGWHNWVVYDEDADGEFLAVSKFGAITIEERHVKRIITKMQGTDLGTYELQSPSPATPNPVGRANCSGPSCLVLAHEPRCPSAVAHLWALGVARVPCVNEQFTTVSPLRDNLRQHGFRL